MKKRIKTGLSCLLILLLVLCTMQTAFAGTIEFAGEAAAKHIVFAPGSQYTDSDLFDGFKNVMPGDQKTETITFTNTATDSAFVKLYMQAKPHNEENPLSEKVAAHNNTTLAMAEDFLAQLTIKVWNGSKDAGRMM